MKKILPFLMILMMLFAFVACDNGNGDNPNPDAPPVSDPAGTGGSNPGNGNGGNGGGTGGGDSSGSGSAGGSDTGGDGDIIDNPVQEPEILLPSPVGNDEFAGTTWIYEYTSEYGTETGTATRTAIETYVFGTDRTVKKTSEEKDSAQPEYDDSETTYYYYSYDTEKGILSLQIKSSNLLLDFGDKTQYSSCPPKEVVSKLYMELDEEMQEFVIEYLEASTVDEFYEVIKLGFEEMMQHIEYIPYEISNNEAIFYRGFYGDNIDMQTYLDMRDFSLHYAKSNENSENQYSIEGHWDDDGSSYLILTLYNYYESDGKTEYEETSISTTKIEGNTLTWEDSSTSTCSVTWNNTEKRYDFVIEYGGEYYSGYEELYRNTSYTKQ